MARGTLSNVAIGVDVTGQSLASSGAIQSGAVIVGRSLVAQSLSSSGAIESGSVLVSRVMSPANLSSSGAIQSGAITVVVAPSWGVIPDRTQDWDSLTPYDVSVYLDRGDSPITYSLVPTLAEFSINASTGVITPGTPTEDTDHTINVRATNSQDSDDQSFTWTVVGPPDPIPPDYPNFTSITGQVINIDAKNGWQNITEEGTWLATGLPPTLLMSSDGIITGTVVTPGVYSNVIITYNDGMAWAADPFTWTVEDPPPSPGGGGSGGLNLQLNLAI